MVRGVLHTVQLFQQISASLSKIIIELNVVGPAPPFGGSLLGGSIFGETLFGKPQLELPGVPDRIDRLDWVELLCPSTAVNELVLRVELSENIVHVLEVAKREMAAHVLPALHTLTFIDRFVSARQNAGRPVPVKTLAPLWEMGEALATFKFFSQVVYDWKVPL
ncbi:hypothetical protein EDB85DRAFT_2148791 [Lactarius pseudohatsudake]|nr:hypothetical protein EDB85DRAFT_2148791 [Lactarius pseudohatsudake]